MSRQSLIRGIWCINYVTDEIDPMLGRSITYSLIMSMVKTLVRLDVIEDDI